MHLPTLPTTLSLLLLLTTTTTAKPRPIAIDLSPRHGPPQTSSFTGASTLTGPAPTIETDSEPVLNHAAPLAQTTDTSLLQSQGPIATSLVSNSILMESGTPIETLIPIYTGTPPLVVTDAAGDAVGTSSAKKPKATGSQDGDEGGTLLDMTSSSSSSSSSGAKSAVASCGKGKRGILMALTIAVTAGVIVI